MKSSAPSIPTSTAQKRGFAFTALLWAIILTVWWWPDESRSKMGAEEKFLELSPDIVTVQSVRFSNVGDNVQVFNGSRQLQRTLIGTNVSTILSSMIIV